MSTIPASSLCHIVSPRGPVVTRDTIVDDHLATVSRSARRLHTARLGRALRARRPNDPPLAAPASGLDPTKGPWRRRPDAVEV